MTQSNVGNAKVHEANEQVDKSNDGARFHEGKANAHNNLDSKDDRSIANKLASVAKNEAEEPDIEKQRLDKDATLPARAHGNEPSRGAVIDQQIREEEAEYLKRKGKA